MKVLFKGIWESSLFGCNNLDVQYPSSKLLNSSLCLPQPDRSSFIPQKSQASNQPNQVMHLPKVQFAVNDEK